MARSKALAVQGEDSWSSELAAQLQVAMSYGALLFKSGMMPRGVKSEASAQALCLHAVSMGIHPAKAGADFWIPDGGRPVMYADACVRRILEKGGSIEDVELTDEICTLRGKRHDGTVYTKTVRAADYRHLHGKDNWKNYRKRMLRAACVRNLAKDCFADYLGGTDVGEPGDSEPRVEVLAQAPAQIVEAKAEPARAASPVARITEELTTIENASPAAKVFSAALQDPRARNIIEAKAEAELAPQEPLPLAPDDDPIGPTPAEAPPAERFDLENPEHRKLVLQAYDARGIPPRFRNMHREKLRAFLAGLDNLTATFAAVDAALESYILANPPRQQHEVGA